MVRCGAPLSSPLTFDFHQNTTSTISISKPASTLLTLNAKPRMFQEKESAKEYLQHSKRLQFSMCQTLMDRIVVKPSDNVFEIGCGTGEYSAYLATDLLKNGRITGCDPEENRIKVAKEKFSDITNLSYIHARGSEALQNTTNLYDIIFSSNVLHWMSDKELELATERQFMAMKSGAIAAHLFGMSVPENMAKILAFLNDDLNAKFHEALNVMPLQKMINIAQRNGFEVVRAEDLNHVTEFSSVDEYLTLLDATLYGKFGCKEIYHKCHDKIKLEKIMADGKLIQSDTIAIVILKKP